MDTIGPLPKSKYGNIYALTMICDFTKSITIPIPEKNAKTITYVIGYYNPSVRIIDLVSHATYVACIKFIHKWRDLQFKVLSERQIFLKTFRGNFIYSQNIYQKSAKRKSLKKYFSYFVLMCGLGLEP